MNSVQAHELLSIGQGVLLVTRLGSYSQRVIGRGINNKLFLLKSHYPESGVGQRSSGSSFVCLNRNLKCCLKCCLSNIIVISNVCNGMGGRLEQKK